MNRKILTKLTDREKRIMRKLNSPEKIQRFIDGEISVNSERNGETISSFRTVLKTKRAHCLEGALFACAVLYYHGFPPLVGYIEAREDSDHAVSLYKVDGMWGSIGQSMDQYLKGREPKYRTIKDLMMSYHPYYHGDEYMTNLTMRGYAKIDLRNFREDWITSKKNLDFIEEGILKAKFRFLFPRKDESAYYKVNGTGEAVF